MVMNHLDEEGALYLRPLLPLRLRRLPNFSAQLLIPPGVVVDRLNLTIRDDVDSLLLKP